MALINGEIEYNEYTDEKIFRIKDDSLAIYMQQLANNIVEDWNCSCVPTDASDGFRMIGNLLRVKILVDYLNGLKTDEFRICQLKNIKG